MTVRSAGILLWRDAPTGREVWIGHMGGPFWATKDERAWSIPKGEYGDDEDPFDAAVREFEEETGIPAPRLDYLRIGDYRYSSGKILAVFAAEAPQFDPPSIEPGTFDLEWPPRSGRTPHLPEIDRAAWVRVPDARRLLVAGQVPMLDDLGLPEL